MRGASRLAAGRLAAKSPAARAAAGLSDSSNPIKAIKAMLGTTKPTSRNAALRLVRESRAQGYVPQWRTLRAIPGEVADNLRAARTADWGDVLRQVREGGRPSLPQVLGEHRAAADLKEITKIHNVVKASDEVAPHLRPAQAQLAVFGGGTLYNAYDTVNNAVKLATPSKSAAEELHLPAAGRPALEG